MVSTSKFLEAMNALEKWSRHTPQYDPWVSDYFMDKLERLHGAGEVITPFKCCDGVFTCYVPETGSIGVICRTIQDFHEKVKRIKEKNKENQ